MVAARSRILAIWFAALLLVSVIPAVAPVASAGHEEGISLQNNVLLIQTPGGLVPYESTMLVKPNTALSFRMNVTWGASCTNGGLQPASSTWQWTSASMNAGILGASTTLAPTYEGDDGLPARTRHLIFNVTVATAAAAHEANAEGSDKKVPIAVSLKCVDTSALGDAERSVSTSHESPGMTLDAKKPTITVTAQPAAVHTNAVERQSVGAAATAAIGSDIVFTVSVNDEVSNLSLRVSDLNASMLGFNPIANTTSPTLTTASVTLPVKEAGPTHGYATLNGANVKFTLHAVDDAGNVATQVDTNTILVDNVRPGAAANFRVSEAELHVAPGGSRVTMLWTSSGTPNDVAHARVRVTSNEDATGTTVFASPGASIPITLANPYSATVNLTAIPVDAAGNINTAIVHSPQLIQPSEVSVEYGGTPGQPVAVTKSGMFNVYVNVTSPQALPTVPQGPPTAPSVYGILARNHTAGALRYWENGTEGKTIANHFTQNRIVNTAQAPDAGTAETNNAFQPSLALSTPGRYVFNNLSDQGASAALNREFLGGSYQMQLNLSAASGTRTTVTRYFAVDGDLPALVASGTGLGQNNNYSRGVGHSANWTDLHGGDGNPFRVYWAVHDSRTDPTSNSLIDSRLRNVTFELTDLAGTSVVRRTATADDPTTPNNDESLARVNFDLVSIDPRQSKFAYIYDFRNKTAPGAASDCASASDLSDNCVWFRVSVQNNWTFSWFNETNFSAWVNLTFPDLPAGKYKVRALAYDRANGLVSAMYPGGNTDAEVYKVAPIASVVSSSQSPLIRADNKLDVVALASQRYVNPPSEVAHQCVGATGDQSATGIIKDICPASSVRIYVSNTNGANDVGLLYQERALAESTVVDETNVKGWTGWYVNSPAHAKGVLSFNDNLTRRYFQYTSNSPPTLPASINTATDVFVRVVAVAKDANGNDLITSSTGWIKAVSLTTPLIKIQQPCATTNDLCGGPAGDWTINVTSLPGHAKPPFNVTFDRRTDTGGTPKMRYEIVFHANQSVVSQAWDLAPANAGTQAPRVVFNWTGAMEYRNNGTLLNSSSLQPGAYTFKAWVYDGDFQLATAWRNFTILASKPTVTVDASQPSPTLLPAPGNKWMVLPTFDMKFTVNHGGANLTELSQIQYSLLRASPPAGEPGTVANGQFGFSVQTLAESALDPESTTTQFTARVTLPASAANNNTFRLNITANLDVFPFTIGNASGFVDLVVDKQVPTASLFVAATESTVLAPSGGVNSPPRNKEPPTPAFVGTAEDFGAGVSFVEVRIIDLTEGKTVQLTTGGGVMQPIMDGNFWYNNTGPFVTLTPIGNSKWEWTVPLSPFYIHNAQGGAGVINLSHTYRVDVRVRDALGQSPATHHSTTVDFDAAPPFLSYKTQLQPTSTSSGIWVQDNRRSINWHGEGDSLRLTVNVTDNHCIKAVRLVGVSEKNPGVVLKANMTPYQRLPIGSATWSGTLIGESERSRVCPSQSGAGEKIEYRIDLGQAVDNATGKRLTDDVGNWTYWFEAIDWAGQVSEVEASHRLLKIEVLDKSPAIVRGVTFDPAIGQAGGRTLIRADVFDNLAVDRVTIEARNGTTLTLLASANMTRENTTDDGVGIWRADTTEDLGLELHVGDVLFNITAYDVNWNRTIDPTCPAVCPRALPLYIVRDDGAPAVVLESPLAGSTVGASPTLKFRALHKALEIGQISVRATTDGDEANLTAVPTSALNFTELKSANGTRQGWSVSYTPTNLSDNTTLIVNISATIASLVDAKQFNFTVDSLPPTVTANVTGTQVIANKTWATRATRISLAAEDTVSQATIRYSANGGAEQTYAGEITPGGQDGEWKLEYWATDAAGNVAPRESLTLNLDLTGPRITVAKHGDEVLLSVTDAGVGLNESTVTVHYRYGAASAFTPKKLDKLTGNSFGTTLPGNATLDGLSYYFTAEDLLGNTGSNFSAAQPYTIRRENATPENLPPTIRITAPSPGTTVRSSVELRWLAEDPEEAPLTISIALRDPAPGRVLSAAGENSGSYVINTTGFPAGAYTVVVTASDGEHSESTQVTFNVESGEVIQPRNVPPASVPANTQVSVAVAVSPVGKTVATASYRLVRDGQLVTSGQLTPQAGLYGASFTPQTPGNYSVIVEVLYTDGTTEPAKQVAAFRVPGTVTPPGEGESRGTFPVSLMALVAIAVLTVALAGYGAFGRWKK